MIAIYVNINVLAVRILMERQHRVGKRENRGSGMPESGPRESRKLDRLIIIIFLADLFKLPPSQYP